MATDHPIAWSNRLMYLPTSSEQELDRCVGEAVDGGAEIVLPKTRIGKSHEMMAIIRDLDGNRIGFYLRAAASF